MVKKPVIIHIDSELYDTIQKYSNELNLSKETLIVNTLKEKFQDNNLVDPITKDYWLLCEQLKCMLEILETRRILIFSKSNGKPDVKELEKIGDKSHDIKVELQILQNEYDRMLANGKIHVQKIGLRRLEYIPDS